MLKILFKDSVIYTIPSVISAVLAFGLLPLYTRLLSPADYGSLDLLIIFAVMINKVVALEITQGVGRFYSVETNYQKRLAYSSSALWFTLGSYLIFLLIFLNFSEILSSVLFPQENLTSEYIIGIFYITSNGVFYFILNQLRWELKALDYAIVSILVSLTSAILVIIFAHFLNWGLFGVLLGLHLGLSLGIVLGFFKLRNSFRFCFEISQLNEMFKFSVPLVFTSLAVWASSYIDRIMINAYLSTADVGVYAIGFKLASVVMLIMVGVQAAFTPLVYHSHQDRDTPQIIEKTFRLYIAISVILFAILSLFAKDLIELLTTKSFYIGAELVIYLVPAVLLSQMYIFSPGMGIKKKTNYILGITIFGVCLNTCLNYFFITHWGIKGAAIATLLSAAATFILHMSISQRLYPAPHKWFQLLSTCAVSVAVVILSYLFSSIYQIDFLTRFILNVSAIGALCAFFIVVGLVKLSEVKEIFRIIKYKSEVRVKEEH